MARRRKARSQADRIGRQKACFDGKVGMGIRVPTPRHGIGRLRGHARRSSPGRLRHFAAALLPGARFALNARTWEGTRPLGVLFLANSARYNTSKPDMALGESEMSDLGPTAGAAQGLLMAGAAARGSGRRAR